MLCVCVCVSLLAHIRHRLRHLSETVMQKHLSLSRSLALSLHGQKLTNIPVLDLVQYFANHIVCKANRGSTGDKVSVSRAQIHHMEAAGRELGHWILYS